MKYYSVCSLKEYEENGESKKKFYRVGYIKETPQGARYLILYQQPDATYCVFDERENESHEEE